MSETPKSLFRRLAARLTRKRPADPEAGVLGLKTNQLEGLEALTQHNLWRHWQATLEVLLEQRLARLSSGLPHDEYLKLSGETRLLIQLVTLPDTITATERARHEQQRPVEREPSHFLNTPFYPGAVAGTSDRRPVGSR